MINTIHGRVLFSVRTYVTKNKYKPISDGAMMLGKLPVPGRPTIWIIVGLGPTALAVGASGVCLNIFSIVYHFLLFFFLSPGDGPI